MPTENSATSNAKIAVVTGGSRGLGRNTVVSLARRGVNSIFTSVGSEMLAAAADMRLRSNRSQPAHHQPDWQALTRG
jgi:NAD(P)-dependent dehydrogenase (short-subunit alcohol dehydrogenase family)